ncbi:MAG: murein biosynthesis integral membrane protein MurJ, partial [Candidatus Omnitrophica bacterium]|nr:murein biosynthesis integral membrane protein MurJ [Candidatus Omnitrophota bacterium]
MKTQIAKNAGIISLGTNLSRILGLVRDILIAKFFGTTYEAASFVVAFTIPNMLRDFVGEGAANAAFVPVLTEYRMKKTPEEFWNLANNIVNILTVALIGISVLGICIAPFIVRLMAPGFIREIGALALTVKLARIIFPYLIFIGLTACGMGILNTLRHFAAPAFGPVLMNISIIFCAIFLCPIWGVMGLAFGVLIGGACQLFIQVPVLYKSGFRLKPVFNLFHPATKKIGLLLAPRIVGSAVYQINILVDRMLASLFWVVGTGGIPAMYYSYRLIQYPLAIFSTALATAALPVMSQHALEKDYSKLRETVSFSLRSIFFIMIPASIGLAVLGKPIIQILFQRGTFGTYSTDITYQALLFYTIGLFAYGGIRILATTFYSLNDTFTPVKVAACSLAINVVFNLILMWPLKIGGLALATSIAAIFNFVALYILLG